MVGDGGELTLDGDGVAHDLDVVDRPERGELRELVRWQQVTRHRERAGLVDRVLDRGRPAERCLVTGHRTGSADDTCGTVDGAAVERAQVVLEEVVGEQQAVAERVRVDDALLLGEVVQAVVDAADDPADQVLEQAVVRRRLTAIEELASGVEVVADRQRQVLLALGDRAVGQVERPKAGNSRDEVLGVLRQPVVAEVPQHGGVVAEDAEVVWRAVRIGRRALGVDVPDIRRDPVGLERRDVLVEVLRRAASRRRALG